MSDEEGPQSPALQAHQNPQNLQNPPCRPETSKSPSKSGSAESPTSSKSLFVKCSSSTQSTTYATIKLVPF